MYEEVPAIMPTSPVQFSAVKARIEEREVRVDFTKTDRQLPHFPMEHGPIVVTRAFLTYTRDHQDLDPQAVWGIKKIKLCGGDNHDRYVVTITADSPRNRNVPWWLVQLAVQGKSYI